MTAADPAAKPFDVGVIGIGAMGLPMALRLAERGHRVAVVDCDPTRTALARQDGLTVLPSPAALAERARCLIVAVVDAVQADAVLFGVDGAFGGGPPEPRSGWNAGSAVADGPSAAIEGREAPAPLARSVLLCPTLGPDDVEALGGRLAARGVAMVEAPMSGGPRRARDGRMSLMVAGDPQAVAAHARLLDALSDRQIPLGARLGDGARVKLVNNLLAASHLAAAAEAMALARRVGLSPATVLDVLERSSGQSWIGSDRMRRWLAAHDAEGNPAPAGTLEVQAALALLAKDTRLAAEMAEAIGLPLEITAAAVGAFAQAARDGRQGWDDGHLVDWVAGRR